LDLSFLDWPEALEIIFPLYYSPWHVLDTPASVDVPGYFIEVEEGIKIHYGLWAKGKEYPTILYFHGNGETVAGHEWVAPFYNERGINLFVADYRGYGLSDDRPTIANLLNDADIIFREFKKILSQEGFKESLFLMGHSLGSLPATEIALNHQEEICGLIIESGTANNFRRLWEYLGITGKEVVSEEGSFLNKIKIRQVHRPTLIIHGEEDQTIAVTEGKELYQYSGSKDKRILIIPGAGHNDIMMVDSNLYFDTIKEFVTAHN
jgi:alpha-beta hydrolase superfamily lysophospholipase